MANLILTTSPQPDYELLDSGEGEKLERFGHVTMIRPDPQAIWAKTRPEEWHKADMVYKRSGPKSGAWHSEKLVKESWEIDFGDLTFQIKPTSFKHVGLFPEQLSNWQWLSEVMGNSKQPKAEEEKINILNLFAYTGGASLACARAGAKVTHVDSSKAAITWANLNAKCSGLDASPIRWILEDAYEFVKKEIRRGNTYDGIIMDPPSFGHGTSGEIWKIEKQLIELIADSMKLLAPSPLFFLISGYAAGYSSIAYQNNLEPLLRAYGGSIEHGELALAESHEHGRLLPAGIFARWSR